MSNLKRQQCWSREIPVQYKEHGFKSSRLQAVLSWISRLPSLSLFPQLKNEKHEQGKRQSTRHITGVCSVNVSSFPTGYFKKISEAPYLWYLGSLLYKHQMYTIVLIRQLDPTRQPRSLAWEGGQIKWHLYVGIAPSTQKWSWGRERDNIGFVGPITPNSLFEVKTHGGPQA